MRQSENVASNGLPPQLVRMLSCDPTPPLDPRNGHIPHLRFQQQVPTTGERKVRSLPRAGGDSGPDENRQQLVSGDVDAGRAEHGVPEDDVIGVSVRRVDADGDRGDRGEDEGVAAWA